MNNTCFGITMENVRERASFGINTSEEPWQLWLENITLYRK